MMFTCVQLLTTIVAAAASNEISSAGAGGIPASASAGGIPASASAGGIPASASAGGIPASAEAFMADSLRGGNLLANSRRLNQQYEEDLTWMNNYSIKYGSCHTIHSYGGEGAEEEGGTPAGLQHLVKYHLCPTTSNGDCKNCGSGGSYVAEAREFVEAYLEVQKEIEEAKCQSVEENCNCNYYNDDDVCLAKCYEKAGLSNCQNEDNDFDAGEFMECREAEFGNNYYGTAFYIGPVCTGKGIFLKLYSDASCTTAAPSGTYEKYNYNYALPYSKKSIVDTTCISCKEQDDNNNNNNNNGNNNNYYQAAEPIEMCQEIYEQSAKCEKNLKSKESTYRDTGSCTYINKVLPALEKVYHRKGGGAATGFAVFFSITTVAASAAAYYFYTKVERTSVDLSNKDESVFA